MDPNYVTGPKLRLLTENYMTSQICIFYTLHILCNIFFENIMYQKH